MTTAQSTQTAINYIVSTDLDGTLLDHHNYAWEAAQPAITLLQKQNIPIIFNTSKTMAEALALQKAIGIEQPVIVENGSALAIPNQQMPIFFPEGANIPATKNDAHTIFTFGCTREEILKFIDQQKQALGAVLESYNDWPIETIAEKTGLPLESAHLSANKGYSEPFIWQGSEEAFAIFDQHAQNNNLSITQGGRFYHLLGKTSKAKPLQWLCDNLNKPTLICLGDNKNDIAMLNIADIPVCVKSPTSPYPEIAPNAQAIFTEGCGPVGWNEAIQRLFSVKNG